MALSETLVKQQLVLGSASREAHLNMTVLDLSN